MPAADWICKILNFQRSERLKGSNCINMPNFIEIAQTAAEMWPFYDFQDGGRRHLGFVTRVWGPPTKGILVVFITVQSLAGIDAVVLIICAFFDFASLA